MKCPNCNANQTFKKVIVEGDSATSAKHCGCQFLESYRSWRYSDDVKQLCIKLYLNGMGVRGIERVTNIHYMTLMHWIREAGHEVSDAPETDELPEITDHDEVQPFVGNKRHNLWIWTALNHQQAGILAWVMGERSAKTFESL